MDDRDWLTLLLDDAPPAELRRQRDRLCTGPGPLPWPDADRQLGEAMQLRTLLAERRQRTAGLTALNDTALALASLHGTEIGSLLELVVARAKQLLGVDLAYLGLVHGDEMSIAAASGAVTRDLVGLTVPTRAGLAGQVTARREPVWTSDYRATSFEHLADVDKVAEAELYRSLLGVPLLSQDELIGLLFACKRYERQFAAEEIATLTTLGAHATTAIVNRRRLARAAAEITALDEENQRLRARCDLLESTARAGDELDALVAGSAGTDEITEEAGQLAGCDIRYLTADAAPPPWLTAGDAPLLADAAGTANTAGTVGTAKAGASAHRTGAGWLIVAPVLAAGRASGVLVAADRAGRATRPSAAAEGVLGRAARAVALAVANADAVRVAARHAQASLLAEVLSRPSADARTLVRQMQRAGLGPSSTYWAAAIRRDDGEEAPLPRQLPAGVVAADLPGHTVLVLPGKDAAAVRETAARLAPGRTVGLAGPACGGPALAAAARDARQVAGALAALGRTGQVATADDLGVFRIPLSEAGRRQVEAAIERVTAPLRREEARRGVPLVETLEAYVRSNGKPAETAAALKIHPNTLYRRLGTIADVLGPDWRDSTELLELRVLFMLGSR